MTTKQMNILSKIRYLESRKCDVLGKMMTRMGYTNDKYGYGFDKLADQLDSIDRQLANLKSLL